MGEKIVLDSYRSVFPIAGFSINSIKKKCESTKYKCYLFYLFTQEFKYLHSVTQKYNYKNSGYNKKCTMMVAAIFEILQLLGTM